MPNFLKHFEIEKMITPRCISVVCFKLRNQRFCFKQFIEDVDEKIFPSVPIEEENNKTEKLDLIKPWINTPP